MKKIYSFCLFLFIICFIFIKGFSIQEFSNSKYDFKNINVKYSFKEKKIIINIKNIELKNNSKLYISKKDFLQIKNSINFFKNINFSFLKLKVDNFLDYSILLSENYLSFESKSFSFSFNLLNENYKISNSKNHLIIKGSFLNNYETKNSIFFKNQLILKNLFSSFQQKKLIIKFKNEKGNFINQKKIVNLFRNYKFAKHLYFEKLSIHSGFFKINLANLSFEEIKIKAKAFTNKIPINEHTTFNSKSIDIKIINNNIYFSSIEPNINGIKIKNIKATLFNFFKDNIYLEYSFDTYSLINKKIKNILKSFDFDLGNFLQLSGNLNSNISGTFNFKTEESFINYYFNSDLATFLLGNEKVEVKSISGTFNKTEASFNNFHLKISDIFEGDIKDLKLNLKSYKGNSNIFIKKLNISNKKILIEKLETPIDILFEKGLIISFPTLKLNLKSKNGINYISIKDGTPLHKYSIFKNLHIEKSSASIKTKDFKNFKSSGFFNRSNNEINKIPFYLISNKDNMNFTLNKNIKLNVDFKEDTYFFTSSAFNSKFFNKFFNKDYFKKISSTFEGSLSDEEFKGIFSFNNLITTNNVPIQVIELIDNLTSLFTLQYNYEREINGIISFSLINEELNLILSISTPTFDLQGSIKINLDNNKLLGNLNLSYLKQSSTILKNIPVVNNILTGKDLQINTNIKLTGTLNDYNIESSIINDAMTLPFNMIKRVLSLESLIE